MISAGRLTSGSTSGSIDTTDDEDDDGGDFSVTSNDTLDLGHSRAGGGSQNFDLENNAGAVVETSSDIEDAGGPSGVLVGTEEQASKVKETVSEVSGQLRDMASSDESAPVDNTDQNAASDGSGQTELPTATSIIPLDQLPTDFGLPDVSRKKAVAGAAVVVGLLVGGT